MALDYMSWIENYNLNFQLHLLENTDSNIYKKIDLTEVTGNLSKFNNTIVDVFATSMINNEYHFKIKYKDNPIGWCSPDSDSIFYIKSKRREVKISNVESINNELNEILKVDTRSLSNEWFKIFISDFFAIYKDQVYCGILLKDELQGFINVNDVNYFKNLRSDFRFNDNNISLYKDSKLEKPVIEHFEHKDKMFKSLGGFENSESIRVIIDGTRYWTNIKKTNLSLENEVIITPEERVIDALLYQQREKIKLQKEFYDNKIEKMKNQIEDLKVRENNLKQKIKNIREVL